jgi:pSer/pThr/pTyr-binding forkhead associated (FHA) protein
MVDGQMTFNLRQLWRVATRLGLDFERFRGAERVFALLESSGYVKIIRSQQTGFHTQYCPTDLGIAQTIVALDRLKKMQGLEPQAKTMQSINTRQPSAPAVYEAVLDRKRFTIGSSEENDLCVDDRDMSPKHARVTYESGRWMFEDLNSGYGSWKMEPDNLRRLSRAELEDSDLYQLGSTIIRFRIPSALRTQ